MVQWSRRCAKCRYRPPPSNRPRHAGPLLAVPEQAGRASDQVSSMDGARTAAKSAAGVGGDRAASRALLASASALGLWSAGTGDSVVVFKAQYPHIAKVAVTKFRHFVEEVLGVLKLMQVQGTRGQACDPVDGEQEVWQV